MTDTFVQPIWVVAPHESLRLQIAIIPELIDLICEGTQLITIRRDEYPGHSREHGWFMQCTSTLVATSGLILGLHKKLYIDWRMPEEEPLQMTSRLFADIMGLPIDRSYQRLILSRSIHLIQWEKFAMRRI
jgi:hypothetical protein